jgi:hypothetical protein
VASATISYEILSDEGTGDADVITETGSVVRRVESFFLQSSEHI